MKLPITAFYSTLLFLFLASCSKDGRGGESAKNVPHGLECDHQVRMSTVVEHAWPYPAQYRDLRWTGGYGRLELRLKPTRAAFLTATIGVKDGDILRVLDSEIQIAKPRRLVAKRDLFVTRTEVSQGVEVERNELAVAKGEVGNFLFYNSEGRCIIGTENGPGWTECTLDDAFEGLSEANPFACEQAWWVQLQRRKIDKGWVIVEPAFIERILPEGFPAE